MTVVGKELISSPELKFSRSTSAGRVKLDYVASMRDLTGGTIEATVTPAVNDYVEPVFSGETDLDRLEAAITDALATEFAETRQDVIDGWVLGKPDVDPRTAVYDVEMFVPDSSEDEQDVLGSYRTVLPYDFDESMYALYRLGNRTTGVETYSFVCRVDDAESSHNGRWYVESRVDDDEDDEAETT